LLRSYADFTEVDRRRGCAALKDMLVRRKAPHSKKRIVMSGGAG
jgi:hypothetical protein